MLPPHCDAVEGRRWVVWIEKVALELVHLRKDGDQVVVPEHAYGHGCW